MVERGRSVVLIECGVVCRGKGGVWQECGFEECGKLYSR